MVFRRSEPDEKVVGQSRAAHESQKKVFQDYFLGSHKFVAGDLPSIADILMASTLLQTSITGYITDGPTERLDNNNLCRNLA